MAIDVPDFLRLTQLAAPALLGAVTVPVGQAGASPTFVVSPFATGVAMVPLPTLGAIGMEIQGTVSSHIYAGVNFENADGSPLVASILGNIDSPVRAIVTLQAVNPGPNPVICAYVYQLFGASIDQVLNTRQQPLFAQLMPGFQDQTAGSSVLHSAHVSTNLAAGASATVISGFAGEKICVYGYDVGLDQVGAIVNGYQVTIEDTTAAVTVAALRTWIDTAVGQTAVRSSLDIPMGLLLPAGAGVKVVANVANAGACLTEGVIMYTQA